MNSEELMKAAATIVTAMVQTEILISEEQVLASIDKVKTKLRS